MSQDGGVDDVKVQAETLKSTPSPPSPSDSGLEAPSTASSSHGVSTVHLAGALPDNVAVSARLNEKESHSIEHNAGTHKSHISDASTTTLGHNSIANNHKDQDVIDSDNKGANYSKPSEEHAGDIASHGTNELGGYDKANNRGFQKHKHNDIDERRKLVPKHQQDRKRRPASSKFERDYASEIVMEQATDTNLLPEGYLGTWRGFQFFSPSLYHTGLCGAEVGLHRLTCGHWVGSFESCGVNCNCPVYENEAFVCDKCYNNVKDILDHRLGVVEKETLERAGKGYHVFYVALAVEFVSKHKVMKGNVTETVMTVLDGYGHSSVPSGGPKEPNIVPLKETIGEIQRLHERKEFEAKNPLLRHEKRSHIEINPPEPEVDETDPTSRHKHKKHKTGIEKHPSPTSRFTHGTKRRAVDADVGIPRSRTKKVATAAEVAFSQPSNRVNLGVRKRDLAGDNEDIKEAVPERRRFANNVYDDESGS